MKPAEPAEPVAALGDGAAIGAAPSPEAFVNALDESARMVRTPIPGGADMVWRVWGSGPPVVLLHGGYGSWRHFACNVGPLSRHATVLAADMPGFGDSGMPPQPTTIDGMAEIVATGARQILGGETLYSVVGFSFGSAIGTHITRSADGAIDRLVLVGVNRLGIWPLKRPPMRQWRKALTPDERAAAHRFNLSALMIYDPTRIDDLAVYLQSENTIRARVRSLDIVSTHRVPEHLRAIGVPITAIWGEHDVTLITGPEDAIRGLHNLAPDAGTVVIEGAGHWVQYEAADRFNRALLNILGASALRPSG